MAMRDVRSATTTRDRKGPFSCRFSGALATWPPFDVAAKRGVTDSASSQII